MLAGSRVPGSEGFGIWVIVRVISIPSAVSRLSAPIMGVHSSWHEGPHTHVYLPRLI